eukprot:20041-Heterococcus_DN1.PRE.2
MSSGINEHPIWHYSLLAPAGAVRAYSVCSSSSAAVYRLSQLAYVYIITIVQFQCATSIKHLLITAETAKHIKYSADSTCIEQLDDTCSYTAATPSGSAMNRQRAHLSHTINVLKC